MADTAIKPLSANAPIENAHQIRSYYTKYFPFSLFYRWLSYADADEDRFSRREFSFILEDDVYLRFLSFHSAAELRQEVLRKTPFKIDIGAVYSRPFVNRRPSASTLPIERELIFDIDMTDYDDVRVCGCQGARICLQCWPLMNVAAVILDESMRDDFGFQQRLWVFSGRRGIHCWVCDDKARRLPPQARHAIVDYLTLVKGGSAVTKKVRLGEGAGHTLVKRALRVARPYFEERAVPLLFQGEEGVRKVCELVSDEKMRQEIVARLGETMGEAKWRPIDRWEELKRIVAQKKFAGNVVDEIVLQFSYPRLDANVTHGMNHLLKSPFSAHPKTGRVCIPIPEAQMATFQPSASPTLEQLQREYDQAVADPTQKENAQQTPWRYTSLKEPIEQFERFIRKIEASERVSRARRRQPDLTF